VQEKRHHNDVGRTCKPSTYLICILKQISKQEEEEEGIVHPNKVQIHIFVFFFLNA
jgi:hypothetical protein